MEGGKEGFIRRSFIIFYDIVKNGPMKTGQIKFQHFSHNVTHMSLEYETRFFPHTFTAWIS